MKNLNAFVDILYALTNQINNPSYVFLLQVLATFTDDSVFRLYTFFVKTPFKKRLGYRSTIKSSNALSIII